MAAEGGVPREAAPELLGTGGAPLLPGRVASRAATEALIRAIERSASEGEKSSSAARVERPRLGRVPPDVSELLKEVVGHIAATSAAASSFVGAEQVEHEDAKTAKKEEAEASRQAAAESRL